MQRSMKFQLVCQIAFDTPSAKQIPRAAEKL